MPDGYPDLADFALGQRMIGVVAGLGGQIEGDRQPRLPARQVRAVESVGGRGRAMPRIGAEQPWLVSAWTRLLVLLVLLAHLLSLEPALLHRNERARGSFAARARRAHAAGSGSRCW